MRFLSKGGIDTNDATATADDILFPKTAYSKNGKIVGSIETKYKEISGGITSTKLESDVLLMDISDTYHLATYIENTMVYICNWENNTLGEILDSIDVGHVLKECKMANDLFNGKLYVYCTDTNNLYGLIFNVIDNKFNENIVSFTSNNLSIAINPKKGNMIACAWNDRWYSNVTIVSFDESSFNQITNKMFSGNIYQPPQMLVFWNSEGDYLISRDIGNKRHGIFAYSNSTLTPKYTTAEELHLSTIYYNYYFYNNELRKIEDNSVVKRYAVDVSSNGYMWVYNDIWYVINFDMGTITANRIEDDLELTPMFVEKINESIKLYNDYSTICTPTKNYLMLSLNDFYAFVSEDITINYESINVHNINFLNTEDATATANNILEKKTAYLKGDKVQGTMPDNGELEYTPSEQEQIIPEGYTSGGKVNPMSYNDALTPSEYSNCLIMSEEILNNEVDIFKILNSAIYNYNLAEDFSKRNVIDTGIPQEQLLNGYTVIAVIEPTIWTNLMGVFGRYSDGTPHGIVGLHNEGNALRFNQYGEYVSIPINEIPLNKKSLIVCIFNGNGTGTASIYLNGKLKQTSTSFADLQPNGNIILGESFVNRKWNGIIHNFALFKGVLNDEDIKLLSDYFNS